jgi:hypothetical protein
MVWLFQRELAPAILRTQALQKQSIFWSFLPPSRIRGQGFRCRSNSRTRKHLGMDGVVRRVPIGTHAQGACVIRRGQPLGE